jgi:hypothetical protein
MLLACPARGEAKLAASRFAVRDARAGESPAPPACGYCFAGAADGLAFAFNAAHFAITETYAAS